MLRLHAWPRPQGAYRRHKTAQGALVLCLLSLSLTTFSSACVWAQEADKPPASVETGDKTDKDKDKTDKAPEGKEPKVAVPLDYKLNVGDVIDIAVVRHKELSATQTILPDGNVTLPIINQMNVKGLTVQQVSDRIVKALSGELLSPKVLTTVVRRAPREANVLGDGLRSAGKRQLTDDMRVMQLISEAGGFAGDRPEFVKGVLFRGAEAIPINIVKLFEGDASQNLKLETNDVLYFTKVDLAKMSVTVAGEIDRPGTVEFPRDAKIRTALARVGQPKPSAWLSHSLILHPDGKKTEVDLRGLLTDGEIKPDIPLIPGDTIIIPDNKLRYAVLGAVGRPSEYMFPETQPLTVINAISMAGGLSADADVKKAGLYRKGPDGVSKIVPLNLERLVNPTAKISSKSKNSKSKNSKTGEPADTAPKVAAIDTVLQPDDQLVIPRKSSKQGFDAREILSYINAFGVIRNFSR